MQVMMLSTSASAALGKQHFVAPSAASSRPSLLMAKSNMGTRRHFLRELQHKTSTASRAGACRPASFSGSRWGATGPAGFGCGGALTPEDCNRMAQEFEKAMFGGNGTASGGSARAGMPIAVDVSETADEYLFVADLPGVKRTDTKVQANRQDRMLTISGERPAPAATENQQDTQRRTQRHFGKFNRSFKLPKDAELSKISASFTDGVLTVTIARVQPTEPEVVNVPVDIWAGGGGQA